jgi:hypothetical protein
MASLRTLVQLTTGVILVALTASGQIPSLNLPCVFEGSLLRDSRGHIVQYTSDEMKQRATSKEDLNGFIKQLDFRSVMVLKLLVSESGKVVCVRTISGIPIARKPTEEAVRRWKFRVATTAGKPVSYVGWLEFTLCNTACRGDEYGVTLLK